MDLNYYKIVLLPIAVSAGVYCWGPGHGCKNEIGSMYTHVCGHFDNEGGHPRCSLDIAQLKYTPEGFVKKPEECLRLQDEVHKTTSTKKDEKKAKVSKGSTPSSHKGGSK